MNQFYPEDGPIFQPESLLDPTRDSDGTEDIDSDAGTLPSTPIENRRRQTSRVEPCNAILLHALAPDHPELAQTQKSFDSESTDSSDRNSSTPILMDTTSATGTVQADRAGPYSVYETPVSGFEPSFREDEPERKLDADLLKNHARAAVAATEAEASGRPDVKDLATRSRVDSAKDGIPQISSEPRPSRQSVGSPLKLQTHSGSQTQSASDDTIAISPTLRKHVISPPEDMTNTLSALQPISPTQEAKEQLPSISQLTSNLSHLTDLADAAAIQETRQSQQSHQPSSHHHSYSFGSTTSQSPRRPSFQTSPASYFAHTARSPTSTISEGQHYQSPPQWSVSAGYYAARRSSVATEHAIGMPPSLPSASSSAESHGHTSSSTDGYSTAHTTPIEHSTAIDGTPRPVLPPPHGMSQNAIMMPTGYRCDQPGCTAVPFQTQYLLSSHKNVHSQNRPHYCPVQDCPRSEGGKGFKRKNEMIRHGLVHNSPGYICPFCPDREHRYPRPDNLQRHVRVHHVDKDRDDAALRDVLAQRNEGAGKARRRRTNGSISGPVPAPGS